MKTNKLKTLVAGLSTFAVLFVLTSTSAFAAERTTRTTTVNAGRGGVTVTKTTTTTQNRGQQRTVVKKEVEHNHRGKHAKKGKNKNWKRGHDKRDCRHGHKATKTTTYHRSSQPVLVKRTVRKPGQTTVTYVNNR